jgi:hypothetical protein
MVIFGRKVLLLLMVISLSLFLFSEIAECKGGTKIILVKGEPKIMKQGSSAWNTCKKNSAVDNGDRIKTLKDEAVEISFSDDSKRIIKIDQNSDAFIRKCESPYSVELLNGEAMAFLEKLPKGSTFEIRTPTGISGARGTGWSVTAGELKAIFKSFENTIYVKGIDAAGNEIEGELEVREGWQSIVDKFQKPGALERLESGDLDRWNEWKKDLMDRLENLKERGFEQAGQMQNKIQQVENKKASDFKDARDSDTIAARENAPENRNETRTSENGGNGDNYSINNK